MQQWIVVLLSSYLVFFPLTDMEGQDLAAQLVFPADPVSSSQTSFEILSDRYLTHLTLINDRGESIPFTKRVQNNTNAGYLNHYIIRLPTPSKLGMNQIDIHCVWEGDPKSISEKYVQFFEVHRSSTHAEVVNASFSKDSAISGIQIYPNPSQGEFIYLQTRQHNAPHYLKVYDVFGQLVDEMNLVDTRTIYRANHLKNGQYIFSFISDEKIVSEKVKISRE